MSYEGMTPEELEAEANRILAGDLQNRQSNKARVAEYPILSEYQLERRRRREVPFTSLGILDKVELGLRTDD